MQREMWREKFNNVTMIPIVNWMFFIKVCGDSVDRCAGVIRQNLLSANDCLTHKGIVGANPNYPNWIQESD